MVPRAVLAAVFDRSQSPLSRFAACGLIGSILGLSLFVTNLRDRGGVEWWQVSLGGGIVGYIAALIGWLWDVVKNPTRSRRCRVVAGAVMASSGLCVSILIVAMLDRLISHKP